MSYQQAFEQWRAWPAMRADLQAQMDAIAGDEQAIRGAFGGQLQFGTAGLRGVMGPGPNRLNVYTVRRAALGMAAWLKGTDLPQRCAIGYDSRHNSRLFTEVCACAFAENGIETWIYHELAPTPMLSYAVRAMDCGCGIVISASHNSGEYNGVKCYGPDGCQMTDEPAKVVMGKIESVPALSEPAESFETLLKAGKVRLLPEKIWQDYYDVVLAEGLRLDEVPAADLHVVYTPLCGTGNKPVREILRRIGVHTAVVACQEQPDGDFKTCEYPNPETDEALRESYRLAAEVPCDLIFGTDPDCDRIAAAVPVEGGFRKFTGNELGCLLLDYVLRTRREFGTLPGDGFCVRSIVTTALADRICEKYGVKMRTVLTGFKWIGGEILKEEEQGRADKFIFGFEESCGYLKGTYARDKDAVVAAMLVCEMAAWYKLQGKDLAGAMDAIYEEFGYTLAKVISVELKGVDAMEKAAALMQGLRADTPDAVAECPVTQVLDYQASTSTALPGGDVSPLTLPKSNVIELCLGDAGRMIVRPSGTEPKVKFYLTAVAASRADALDRLADLQKDMQRFVPAD